MEDFIKKIIKKIIYSGNPYVVYGKRDNIDDMPYLQTRYFVPCRGGKQNNVFGINFDFCEGKSNGVSILNISISFLSKIHDYEFPTITQDETTNENAEAIASVINHIIERSQV